MASYIKTETPKLILTARPPALVWTVKEIGEERIHHEFELPDFGGGLVRGTANASVSTSAVVTSGVVQTRIYVYAIPLDGRDFGENAEALHSVENKYNSGELSDSE